MRRVLGCVVAGFGLLAFACGGVGGGPAGLGKQAASPVAQRAAEPPKPALPEPPTDKPWRIAATKPQPLVDQLLIQVVVPDGSTLRQIQAWTPEVRELYRGQAKTLFINWHAGRYDAANVSTMVASDGGDGEPYWCGPDDGADVIVKRGATIPAATEEVDAGSEEES